MDWILSIIPGGWMAAIGAALVAGAAAVWRAYTAGRNTEKAKQALRDREAANDRLEMNREATDIERQETGKSDKEARQEASRWSKR